MRSPLETCNTEYCVPAGGHLAAPDPIPSSVSIKVLVVDGQILFADALALGLAPVSVIH